MVDERRCPHCSGPVTIDGQPYGQKYISCPYCAGESRIHEGQLIAVSEEEVLRLEEQRRSEEPVYHYSPEQEAAMVRRDYLRRELEFYKTHGDIRGLRPSTLMIARLEREIEDLDGIIAGYATPVYPSRKVKRYIRQQRRP